MRNDTSTIYIYIYISPNIGFLIHLVTWFLHATKTRRRPVVSMGPNLITTNLRSNPPPAEAGTISVIPIIDEDRHVRSVLREICWAAAQQFRGPLWCLEATGRVDDTWNFETQSIWCAKINTSFGHLTLNSSHFGMSQQIKSCRRPFCRWACRDYDLPPKRCLWWCWTQSPETRREISEGKQLNYGARINTQQKHTA